MFLCVGQNLHRTHLNPHFRHLEKVVLLYHLGVSVRLMPQFFNFYNYIMQNLIKRMSANVNSSSNIDTTYWRKLKRNIKIHLKQTGIKEITFSAFEQITGLNSKLAKKMLIEINKDCFSK